MCGCRGGNLIFIANLSKFKNAKFSSTEYLKEEYAKMRNAVIVFFAALLLAFAGAAWAQTETGQISGTVLDQQGNGVPKAKITIRNIGTGALRETVSDDHGSFVVTNLLPAKYAVLVEAAGFTKLDQKVDIAPGARIGLDLKLEVGKVSETIEVSATALAVNTETQTLGQVIDSIKIADLPLLTRNPYDLVGIAGNVSRDEASNRGAGFVINGLRSAGTNILLDGSSNNDEFTASVGQSVPLDSVQEFSVLTNNFTAEYGRASSGVVNLVTKSGTNNYHGTAYEFGRYSRLGSGSFDDNANGRPKPVYTRNQFGYSLGGPIKKEKLFFFSSTEWLRIRSARTEIKEIPAPEFIAASGAQTQAFLAAYGALRPGLVTLKTFTHDDVCKPGPGTPPAYNPTGHGPIACGNPATAANTFAQLAPTTPIFNQVAYQRPGDSGGGTPQNDTESVARVDYILSPRTQMYARYALDKGVLPAGAVSNSPYDGYDTGQTTFNQNALFSITHTFGPRWVSQSKAVLNRLTLQQPLGKNPVGPTLYFRDSVAATFASQQIALPGYSAFTPGSAVPFGGPQNLGQVYQDLSVTKGAHQLRFGGSYVYIQDNRVFGAYEEAVEALDTAALRRQGLNRFVNGTLRRFRVAIDPQGKFPCKFTSNPIVAFDPTDPANLDPSCRISTPASAPDFTRSNRYHEFATYFQDSWKFNRRLTLNLGARWEYFGVQHNKDANKDSNYYDGTSGDIFNRILTGQIETTPSSPVGGLWAKDWNNIAPRLGFAWDLFGNGKTAIRGGYGVAYERNFGNVTFNVIQNPPNYAVLQLDLLPIQVSNFGPLAGSIGTQPLRVSSARNVNSNIRTAYAHLWSMSFERQISRNVLFAVDYSGSKGQKLYSLENPNRAGSGNHYLPSVYGALPGNGFAACADPQGFGLCADRIRDTQYTVINRRGNSGTSQYNGLNVRVEGSNIGTTGLTLSFNYTYSHAFDNLSSTFSESNNNFNLGLLDPFNPHLDYGNADFDVRQRASVSAIRAIPFAKNTTGAFKRILDGWQVTPIFSAQTGNPFTLFDCTNQQFEVCPRLFQVGAINHNANTSLGAIAGLTNRFSIANIPLTSIDSSYVDPLTGTSEFGPYPSTMNGRNSFYGPGLWNLDIGIIKNTKITERFSLQFRAEFFNVFNHSNLYFIGEDQDVSGLGTDAAGTSLQSTARRGISPTQNTVERRNVQVALKVIF